MSKDEVVYRNAFTIRISSISMRGRIPSGKLPCKFRCRLLQSLKNFSLLPPVRAASLAEVRDASLQCVSARLLALPKQAALGSFGATRSKTFPEAPSSLCQTVCHEIISAENSTETRNTHKMTGNVGQPELPAVSGSHNSLDSFRELIHFAL